MQFVYLFDDEDMGSISPQWWLNFVEQSTRVLDYNNVNENLVAHNAKFVVKGSCRFLHFENEADYLMFVLRFS